MATEVTNVEQALSYEPFDSQAALRLAQVRNMLNDFAGAERMAQQVYRWGPSHALVPCWRAASLIALIRVKDRDYAQAETWLQRALKLAPREGAVLVNLGNLYLRSGDLERSQHYYRQAVEAAREMVAPHLGLARVLEESGDVAGAKRHYLIALQLDPRSEQALNRVVALCRSNGDYTLALRLARHYDVSI